MKRLFRTGASMILVVTLALAANGMSADSLYAACENGGPGAAAGVNLGTESKGDCAAKTSFSFGKCGNNEVGIGCLVGSLLNVLSAIVGVAVVGGIVAGGIMYSSSRGNPAGTAKGRKIIGNSLLGLALFALTYASVNFLIPGGVLDGMQLASSTKPPAASAPNTTRPTSPAPTSPTGLTNPPRPSAPSTPSTPTSPTAPSTPSAPANPAPAPQPPVPSLPQIGYTVVWQDDFGSGSTLSDVNRSLWHVENFSQSMKGERQVFKDLQSAPLQDRTLFQQNGQLHLVAKYMPNASQNPADTHISSSIISKTSQRYGRITGRIRLPMKRYGDFAKPAATFPAFWALGKRMWSDRPWPSSGELDFMEHVDMGNWVRASVHNTLRNGNNSIHGDYTDGAVLTNTWFIYGAEWTPDEIKFHTIRDPNQSANTVIGSNSQLWRSAPTNVIRKADKPSGVPLEQWWPFDDEIAVILNFSIGGGWVDYEHRSRTGSLPNYTTVCNDPATSGNQEKGCEMLVDWVRFEKTDGCTNCTSGRMPF